MNPASAEKAIRNGAVAGFVVAGITLVVVSVAVLVHPTGFFKVWDDPWSFLDAALVAGLSLGVLRRSRAAAIFLFVYFVAAKVILGIETGSYAGIPLALVFLYFFGRAILGTFVHHRIRQEQEPEYRPVRRWMYFVWVPAVLIGVAFFGLMVLGMLIPTSAVITSDELSQSDIEFFRTEGIIEPDEHIVLFYSTGLLSIREDGNMITDKRVISYEENADQLWIGSAPFDEIRDVSIAESGDLITDAALLVTLDNGESFILYISTSEDGDMRFLDEINKRLK